MNFRMKTALSCFMILYWKGQKSMSSSRSHLSQEKGAVQHETKKAKVNQRSLKPSKMNSEGYIFKLLISWYTRSTYDSVSQLAYEQLESLLLKALAANDSADELEYLKLHNDGDIDAFTLLSQLRLLPVMFKEDIGNIVCFDDFLDTVKQLPPAERSHIMNFITICKLLHVNPATSATGRRSFWLARRLKIWLRSNMTQERFNSLAILHSHKTRSGRISMISVRNEFVSNDNNDSVVRRQTIWSLWSVCRNILLLMPHHRFSVVKGWLLPLPNGQINHSFWRKGHFPAILWAWPSKHFPGHSPRTSKFIPLRARSF